MKTFYALCLCLCMGAMYVLAGQCGDPPIVTRATNNIIGQPPHAEGTLVNYTCAAGYERQGNPSYTCTGGQWTGGNLQCHRITCEHVEAPENGFISNKPQHDAGSSIMFDCNPGYYINGKATMECLVEGVWQPPSPPVCERVHCPVFPSIQHGHTDYVNTTFLASGSELRVTCDTGYVINGNVKVLCKSDGTWETPPTCAEVKCGHHPGLDAECIQSTYFSSNTLFIKCDDTTQSNGDSTQKSSTCDENNFKWSNPNVTCKCPCRVHKGVYVTLNNTDNNGYLRHGIALVWHCSTGSKNTTEEIVCDDGKIDHPGCVIPSATPTATNTLSTISHQATEGLSSSGSNIFTNICLLPLTAVSTQMLIYARNGHVD